MADWLGIYYIYIYTYVRTYVLLDRSYSFQACVHTSTDGARVAKVVCAAAARQTGTSAKMLKEERGEYISEQTGRQTDVATKMPCYREVTDDEEEKYFYIFTRECYSFYSKWKRIR